MALALWAKSAAGTNLAFVKGLSKAVKSWREILHKTLLKKAPKTQPQFKRIDALHRDRYCQQDISQLKTSNSLTSRIFKSLIYSSTTAKILFRNVTRRSMLCFHGSRRSLPLFSLVGITLGLDIDTLMESNGQGLITGIKDSLESYSWVPESLEKAPQCLDDLHINTDKFLASGCEGVIYEAKVKADSDSAVHEKSESYDLAVKAVFNYAAESNTTSIIDGLRREMVPLHPGTESKREENENELPSLSAHLPPHLNIVEMPGMFVDDVLVTEEGLQKFPAAMPHVTDPSRCFGRNKTMYLVMKRTSNNLRSYLSSNPELSMATRCFLLAQFLEGLSHLVSHGIAHRDLKSDNLLVNMSNTAAWPRLQICDFGCCLAEKDKNMQVPFPSLDLFRGGNDWLMAPEIRTAIPGPNKFLDFGKSDLWAAGAIAYEILGADNPFYPSPEFPGRRLKNTTYLEEDLPHLPERVPSPIRRLVRSLLSRDPEQRPTANVAANVVQIVLLSLMKNKNKEMKNIINLESMGGQNAFLLPKEELLLERVRHQSQILSCHLTLKGSTDTLDMAVANSFTFLSRLEYADFRAALKFF